MEKQIHIVFLKDYMDAVVQFFENEGYEVSSRDYQLETFYHWATKNEDKELDSVALIIETFNEEVPIEVKAAEIVKYLTEIKIFKPNMKLIINLPSQFKQMKQMQRSFVGLSIYDFYFEDNFTTQSLLEWVRKSKTLADVKDLIVHEQEFKENLDEENVIDTKKKEKEVHHHQEKKEEPSTRIERVKDKEKVKRFSINVTFPQKETVVEKYVTMYQQKIGFISLSRGAGSTFHSMNLAYYLIQRGMTVGLYEQPQHFEGRTYLADVFDCFNVSVKENVCSVPHLIQERSPIFLEKIPNYQGIAIYGTDYEDNPIQSFNADQYLKYLNTGKHTIKIMDFGYLSDDWFNRRELLDVLNHFDHLVVVVDLMPLSFNPNSKKFMDFQEKYKFEGNLHFLVNRFNSSLSNEEIEEIGLENSNKCNMLSYDEVFKSILNRNIPLFKSKLEIEVPLEELYQNLVNDMEINGGQEIKQRKKKGLKGLFQRA